MGGYNILLLTIYDVSVVTTPHDVTYRNIIHTITYDRRTQLNIICHLVADCRNDLPAFVGNLEWDLFNRGPEETWRWTLETERLFLWEFCKGRLVWGLLYWGSRRICKGRFWKRASLSLGAPLGNLEGFVYRGFREAVKECPVNGVSLPLWEPCEGNLKGGHFY
jgi:hypothetical protein